MHTLLIEAAELARMQAASASPADADLVVLDCRHELSRPQWGEQAYAQGHIANALHAHLDRDLSGPAGPQTGRHPLPDPATFAETLGRWGIDERVQVVAYDQGSGVYASRAWWLLRWMGHASVAVLNGGLAAWQESGLPLTREPGVRTPRTFRAQAAMTAAVTAAEVQQALASGRIALVDARAADRFAGENETIDPVAGHVPGALNHPFTMNLAAGGRFLPASELRRRWNDVLAGRPPRELVAMCGSGVSACHNLLALEIAGLAGARLYAGSWSEWIRDPTRPVARGSSA